MGRPIEIEMLIEDAQHFTRFIAGNIPHETKMSKDPFKLTCTLLCGPSDNQVTPKNFSLSGFLNTFTNYCRTYGAPYKSRLEYGFGRGWVDEFGVYQERFLNTNEYLIDPVDLARMLSITAPTMALAKINAMLDSRIGQANAFEWEDQAENHKRWKARNLLESS